MPNFEDEVNALQQEIEESKQSQQPIETNSNVGDADLQAQLSQLESFAAMDPSVRESKEYQDLKSKMSQSSSQASSNEEEEEEEEEEEFDEEDEDDEGSQDSDSTNPFFAEKPLKKQKEIPVNFEVPKEFVEIMSTHFGVKELPTFLNSVQTWRSQAQEASELRKTQELIQSDLAAMPYEIKMMIDAWSNGKDYLEPIQTMQRLDWEVEHSKQNVETLVERYLPEDYDDLLGQLDDGKISEGEFEQQIKLLSRATKQMFERDKQALKKEREQYVENIEKHQKQFEKSALLSVSEFSKAYPGFSKSEMNKLRTTLTEGKLDDLFFNSDGTYKPEAAKLVAFALHGDKFMGTVKTRAKREGESEANQRIVDTSPRQVKKSGKSTTSNAGVKMDEISHLQGAFKKDPYS